MAKERFLLEGRLDAAKVTTLRQTLSSVGGIQAVEIDSTGGAVSVRYDEQAGSLTEVRQAIEATGFAIREDL